ncbi:MAG: hypothetical protein QOE92_1232, partial [Chloroflexota bacterium]|nr:hypothetical protein [Chloroflexota bacterium]
MAKFIYAEPDDEITNLVDRLRGEKDETDLVFIIPAASRVMHSALNARLLMQYSNSLGKKTSVISTDPRTQGAALETGFPVFLTLGEYESGRALERVEPAPAPSFDRPSDFSDSEAGAPVTSRRP